MSTEFERIVLEKFDNLDSKINELSVEMHEVKEKVEHNSILINAISNELHAVEEKVEHNSNLINTISERLHVVEEKVEHNSILINDLSEKVENNSILINNLSEKVEQQGLNFARFENEFTIKVQALFDSFVANTESHLSYEKSIATLHAKTLYHDNRISVLEDYFKNTKLLANN